MNVSQLVGLIGTGLVIAGYVPQIHHLIKERCTAGLSRPAFAVWLVASLLFLIHAALIRDLVFVGVQVVSLVAGGIIVVLQEIRWTSVRVSSPRIFGIGTEHTL